MSEVIQRITDRRARRQPSGAGATKRAPVMKKMGKSMMENFRDKAKAFIYRYEKLKSLDADVKKYPELRSEYVGLVGRGTKIRDSIRTVTGGIDNVVGWFNSVVGNDKNTQLKGLGLLPLIPVAVVIASLAAMGKWGGDVYMFERRLNEIKRLENTGMSPEKASGIVADREAPGLIAGITREVMVPLSIASVVLVAGWYWANRGR